MCGSRGGVLVGVRKGGLSDHQNMGNPLAQASKPLAGFGCG